MQFWLLSKNGKEKIQLPVNPPSFQVSHGSGNTSIDTIGTGEVSIFGESKLAEFTPLESFFPKEYTPYCQVSEAELLQPYEYIDMLLRWKAVKEPVRLIITNTPVNTLVTIEQFTYGEEGGSRHIKYSLSLKKYRTFELKVSKANPPSQTGTKGTTIQKVQQKTNKNTAQARKDKKAPEGIYTIKKGDTYWKIARAVLGDGQRWKEVKLELESQGVYTLTPGSKVRL